MADESKKYDPDSAIRSGTEVESRDTEQPPRPAPADDTLRSGTEVESRSAEPEKGNRPSDEPPDTMRG